MTKHSPLPWRLDTDNDGEGPYLTGISGPNDEIIVRFDDDYGPAMGANMHLIVRAVNAHADLLAAVRECEWAAGPATAGYCPYCLHFRRNGHGPGCLIAAAIRKTEE